MKDGQQTYRLMGRDRRSYEAARRARSAEPIDQIYGRLDCPGPGG